MNLRSTKTIMLTLFIAFLILSGFYIYTQNADEKRGITAMEGKEIADSVAKNWHNDSIFVYLGSMEDSDKNGFAEKWYYVYYSPSTKLVENNITRYESTYIYVDASYSTIMDTEMSVDSEIGTPIKNWTLDSVDAAEIAKKNPTISSYLSKHGNADTGYGLQITDKYPTLAVWHIVYLDMGYLDAPHNAEIYVDAMTGEVLYVEANV